jgi:hypothetical protein
VGSLEGHNIEIAGCTCSGMLEDEQSSNICLRAVCDLG